MQVKAKINLLYKGECYDAGTIFEMDECTASINQKYNRVEILGGGAVETDEEIVEGLPPLAPKGKKK